MVMLHSVDVTRTSLTVVRVCGCRCADTALRPRARDGAVGGAMYHSLSYMLPRSVFLRVPVRCVPSLSLVRGAGGRREEEVGKGGCVESVTDNRSHRGDKMRMTPSCV